MILTETEQQVLHRTRLLVGDKVLKELFQMRVIIFGVGGVGSWCAESLVRSGIKHLTLVDSDRVCISNVNRQLMATLSTVGRVKVEALRERLMTLNPEANIHTLQEIYDADHSERFDLDNYDVIVDAIDSLAEKAHLILRATQTKALFVSSMGAALKLDPSRVKEAEFWKVKGCPLARALRGKFKRAKTFPTSKFRVVYSDEVLPNLGETDITTPDPTVSMTTSTIEGRSDLANHSWNDKKAQINGTLAHITAQFGMMLAGIILREIYQQHTKN